jgi:hypothetical protein
MVAGIQKGFLVNDLSIKIYEWFWRDLPPPSLAISLGWYDQLGQVVDTDCPQLVEDEIIPVQ